MNVTTFYPDGTSTTRPMTDDEIAQQTADEQMRIDDAWTNLRSERNALLDSSDWTQVADAPVDASAWSTYRQALRDLPANTTDPTNPVWPTPPA